MEQPLVSCIMPTKNRRGFVEQALGYFEKQDYPNKELIIVDDGEDLVVDLVAQRPYVRYFAPQYIHSVGAKRNFACEAARGELICHWDDDDWYSPTRLSYQVAPLLTNTADITGLHLHTVLDIQKMQGWQCADASTSAMGVEGMHYGTMLYRKQLWSNCARFQDSPKGDDGSGFVRRLINLGARVCTLPCANHQIYVRHGKNIWKYQPGTSISNEKWYRVNVEQCMSREEISFYQQVHLQLLQKSISYPPGVLLKNA
ncbi:glycosyltransferase family 2 protein [Dictyobacter kobayashii]|nr:glycosyltransferase family A protein [Dictyobacter kobayashii]